MNKKADSGCGGLIFAGIAVICGLGLLGSGKALSDDPSIGPGAWHSVRYIAIAITGLTLFWFVAMIGSSGGGKK